jgi:subtilisin family serine protease
MRRITGGLAVLLLFLALVGGTSQNASAGTGSGQTYLVVFSDGYAVGDGYAVDGGYAVGGEYAVDDLYAVDSNYAVEKTYAVLCTYAVSGVYAVGESYAVGCDYAVNGTYAVYAVAHDYAVYAVALAGGTVVSDLLKQTGVMVVQSTNPAFADLLSKVAPVETIGRDYVWQGMPAGSGGPDSTPSALQQLQWSMQQIHAPQAHAVQAGAPSVTVGILDTGIDAQHPNFVGADGKTNVDCSRGHNSVAFLPGGPGLGNPSPCVDNAFHGTHVAGIVAARANGLGVVGVAPNVTLVPVKTCDSTGNCYASAVVDGITYAGDQRLNVINMSYFVDDDAFQESTEFKCNTDPTQRAFRQSVARAISYARSRGVVPIAAAGNSDADLAHPADGKDCKVVPAQTAGVVSVSALGPSKEKASYSNWGEIDVAAPGGTGTGDCRAGVLSTLPAASYGCISGTSMASPHAAGVAALIVSQFGKVGTDGRITMDPGKVESILQATAIDQGLQGDDICFGHGRIDALRAVRNDTSRSYDSAAPFCAEYTGG